MGRSLNLIKRPSTRKPAAPPGPSRGREASRATGGPDPAATAELQAAMDAYKRQSGRMFPTWCEVLEVLRGLGYGKPGGATSPQGGGPAHRVRIAPDHRSNPTIPATLVRYGGSLLDSGPVEVYGFASEAARDAALSAIRGACGWTSVEPHY